MSVFERMEQGLYRHSDCPQTLFFHTDTTQVERLEIEESWKCMDGVYLFVSSNLEESGAQDCMDRLLKSGIGAGFVWAFLEEGRLVKWYALPRQKRQQKPFRFYVQNIGLILPKGIQIAWEEEQRSFLISNADASAYRFVMEEEGSLCGNKIRLKMDGSAAGCFSFEALHTGEEWLQPGLWYSWAQPQNVSHIPDYMEFIGFIPFVIEEGTKLECTFDLLRLENEQRTWISVSAESLDTRLWRLFGEPMKIKPQPGAGMVLQKRCYLRTGAFRYYFAPYGKYDILSESGRFVPGLSSLEYIRYGEDASLYFAPHFPAHITQKQELDAASTLPYVEVSDSEKAGYYSQAMQSAFFAMTGDDMLDYAEIPFLLAEETPPVPVMCPQGICKGRQHMEALEVLLAHERNRIMGSSLLPDINTASEEEKTAVTACGLTVCYTEKSLQENKFTKVSFGDDFWMEEVTGALKAAFLNSHPFLLIAEEEELFPYIGKLCCHPCIEGWQFLLTEENWREALPLLLCKYTTAYSITELADRQELWSYGGKKGKERLEQVITQVNNAFFMDLEAFDSLRSLLNDKEWCGALLFSVPVEGQGLPAELQFLLNCAEEGKLEGHYLEFASRSIRRDIEGGATLSDSMISGVICQGQSQWHSPEDIDYSCYLKELIVHMEHSLVQEFQCRAAFVINRLFGAALSAREPEEGNALILEARMEQGENGERSYRYQLLYETEYQVLSSAITGVRFTGLTLQCENADIGRFYLSGRLSLALLEGADMLSYGTVEETADMHGIRRGLAEVKDSWLGFTGLEIRGGRNGYTCRMDTPMFDKDSPCRAGSLAEQFPIYVTGIEVHEDDGILPEDLGFCGMEAGVMQKELTSCWTGIVWRLEFGTMGALASGILPHFTFLTAWSKAEDAEWKEIDKSRENAEPGYYFGGRFGTEKAKDASFSIESVLQVGFGQMEWNQDEAWQLTLRNFFVKILGYSFPPGNNRLALFSESRENPQPGWFASYKEEGK
ncbi:MAG: hypothetical protein NC419_05710 [Muribaculaceae bacterium]|nr:hypothetical protein [Muribaculaceae bacterium]